MGYRWDDTNRDTMSEAKARLLVGLSLVGGTLWYAALLWLTGR